MRSLIYHRSLAGKPKGAHFPSNSELLLLFCLIRTGVLILHFYKQILNFKIKVPTPKQTETKNPILLPLPLPNPPSYPIPCEFPGIYK